MTKFLKCILLLSGLACPAAFGAVAADTANAFAEHETSSTTSLATTGSITVAAGDNLLLVFVSSVTNSGSATHFSSLSWNGHALTYVGQSFSAYTIDHELWELVSPTAGSGTITGTYPQALGGAENVVAIAFSGANTSTPLGTLATNSGSGDTFSVTASGGVSGDLYIGNVIFSGTNASVTATGTGQTQIKSIASGTVTVSSTSLDSIAGSGSGAFAWGTTSPSGNGTDMALAVAVKASGGGSVCTNPGWSKTGASSVPNGTSGLYWGKTGAWVTPDCSTVQYWQPALGNWGVN